LISFNKSFGHPDGAITTTQDIPNTFFNPYAMLSSTCVQEEECMIKLPPATTVAWQGKKRKTDTSND
jgi:hypothetical protein